MGPQNTALVGRIWQAGQICHTKMADLLKEKTDLHVKDGGDPDSTADSFQTQRGHFRVITVLQSNAECCQ